MSDSMNDVKTRGTYPSAIIACLVDNAVEGVARLSRTDIRRLTGISERSIGFHVHKMSKIGAIEIVSGASVTSMASYRIIDPEKVNEGATWTEARVTMMRDRYAHHWNGPLTAMLNALPGQPITGAMVKDWAGLHGLRKGAELLATRQAPKQAPAKPRAPRVRVRKARVEREPSVERSKRTVSTFPVTRSVFSFRGAPAAVAGVVEHVAGRCCWPLVCVADAANSERFCWRHKSLLRSRATS